MIFVAYFGYLLYLFRKKCTILIFKVRILFNVQNYKFATFLNITPNYTKIKNEAFQNRNVKNEIVNEDSGYIIAYSVAPRKGG